MVPWSVAFAWCVRFVGLVLTLGFAGPIAGDKARLRQGYGRADMPCLYECGMQNPDRRACQ
jgi:hypothetical protein